MTLVNVAALLPHYPIYSQEHEYHRPTSSVHPSTQSHKMLSASPNKQLGAALVNELFATALYLVEHVIPKVHKYLSWDFDDHDLGPILPVRTVRAKRVTRACLTDLLL